MTRLDVLSSFKWSLLAWVGTPYLCELKHHITLARAYSVVIQDTEDYIEAASLLRRIKHCRTLQSWML